MKKFLQLSRFKQISLVVFALHVSTIFALCIHHLFAREKPKTKILVRTVAMPPQVIPSVVTSVSSPKKSVKKESPKVAQKPPVPSPKKKETALSQSKTKESTSCFDINASIVQQMEKDLADLEKVETSSPNTSVLFVPKELPHNQETQGPSYGEILVAHLQNSLDLPEIGEVKVELELNSLGHLVRFEVIETKSKKNGEFLKKRLPELILPCFNNDRKSDEVFKFTITFKNLDASSLRSF